MNNLKPRGDVHMQTGLPREASLKERAELIIDDVMQQVNVIKSDGPVTENYILNQAVRLATETALGLLPLQNIEGEE